MRGRARRSGVHGDPSTSTGGDVGSLEGFQRGDVRDHAGVPGVREEEKE